MARKSKVAEAPGSSEAPLEVQFLDFAIPSVVETIEIPIKDLTTDAGTQPRFKLDQDVIDEYAERIKEAKKTGDPYPFPEVDVFRTPEGQIILVDGFHRTFANKKAHEKDLLCNVREGSLQQAVIYSLQANAKHGLLRSKKDKQRALDSFFAITPQEQVKTMTNTDIARIIGTSESFVRTHRPVHKSGAIRKVKSSQGTREVDTSRHGKKSPSKPSPAKKTKNKGAGSAGLSGNSVDEPSSLESAPPADERISLLIADVTKLIGGREGQKVGEAIANGTISLTAKDLKEWAALTEKSAKAIIPLVAYHGYKPYRAYEFISSELSEKVAEDLHLRAIGAGGTFEFQGDGFVITVKHTGKK